jgi:alginate O-acetyltransferase complex protein AlgI
MIFTSFEFAIFFGLVLLIRSFLRSASADKNLLLVASYMFYMSWNASFALLILLSSLIDYFVGLSLGRTKILRRRRLLLAVSCIANLGILAFFKYSNFVLENLGVSLNLLGLGEHHWSYQILLPVGISFFTFQSMSYTIDVYKGKLTPCKSMRDFLLFVAFFPQLVAGPIVRAIDFLPQLKRRARANVGQVEAGLAQFGLGAVKKLVISDQISPHVDMIFANPGSYDSFTLLLGALGYSIQIYCDFSGYSDMAIGCARIMGFNLMRNFRMPYSAVTITEFWRRWHISLSTWLRDYLYIPLGGNRNGPKRMYTALLVTMLLGGLWHGASWNFVIWGVIHGGALAIHKAWSIWSQVDFSNSHVLVRFLVNTVSRAITMSIVLLGWVFFRCESLGAAVVYIERMCSNAGDGARLMSPYILAAVAAVGLIHLVVPKDFDWADHIFDRPVAIRAFGYGSLLFLLVAFGATNATPFIYFQF